MSPTTPAQNAARAKWRAEKAAGTPLVIERIWEMPRKWTFQMPKLRGWVEARMEGVVLNMFGGVTPLTHPEGGTIDTNDIDESLNTTYHRNAYDLTQWEDCRGKYDTVVFDPPYSAHQAVVSYGGRGKGQQVTHARDVVEYVLKPGGRVLSLGFNSTGMSEARGFEKEGILMVNCGASHNDFIVTCERHRP